MQKVTVLLGVSFLTLAASATASDKPMRPASEVELGAIRDALQVKLKDADSAKFLNVRLKGAIACGQLNAKNSYGAYGGFNTFTAFVVQKKDGKTQAVVLAIDSDGSNVAAKSCAKDGM